jgi:ABC-type Fe3+-hydroxamate transport system substrate-binding protein
MKILGYSTLFVLLVFVLVFITGCTTSQPSAPATQASPAATASAGNPSSPSTSTVQAADIDTVINVRFNDLACMNVQDALGTTYLYPDQKFKLSAASPGANTINVNVLFVDENDQLALRQVKPQWDVVRKTWVYTGVVPLVQFNDIITPVEKSFTIKTQSKYYICADDRKETGTNDITYRVPVKLTRL